MEYKDGLHKYNLFVSLHRMQLESSGVPERFWLALFRKLENQVFDAGNAFSIFRIDYEEERRQDGDPVYTVLVTRDGGLEADDESQIYLIDHAWTYESNKAVANLTQIPGLLDRMCNLMGIPMEMPFEEKVRNVVNEMWRYNQTYSQGFGTIESRIPVWYIMDELGSAIEHSDDPNFNTVPFYYLHDQTTYTLLFPVKDVGFNERVTRDYLQGQYLKDKLTREALLIPWRPSSFLDVSFSQTEPGEKYFLSEYINEQLPAEQEEPPLQDTARVLRVYSDYDLINRHLNCPGFEIADRDSADVLWLTSHFKEYRKFQEDSPRKFINQFPCESVLTIKNLLSVVCRRGRGESSDEHADDPPWYPRTYDLSTELLKFVSCYQHRERAGLDNLWICKPWNLARGLDTLVTDNLNCILRLPSSGPKIAQKYVFEPALFRREDVGLVKFDVRYVVLLKSVRPLRAYAYRNFFLRFANKPYDLSSLWDKEKHFTVMNYSEETPLFKMLCDEFVDKFDEQNPRHPWAEVEASIFGALGEMLGAAASRPPPCGIGDNPQSRALYAVDLILCREAAGDVLQPKVLEVNWMPDCQRACEYYPDFFNDVFRLLFKDVHDEGKFRAL